ncbi:hypothetical protein [Bradyrhizobium cosmicum]|uniref:hypothetical protein n=1 Tax=Bradyrhizobium cosmicum TaxID=1404864 RepID=UPI001162E59E|nr:hypothetical protein [Bradyrhizobium cosmicum]QDP26250.1 hypothetical protein FNV92_30635 [Bradyrhizobium cosmicum]
MKRHFLTWLFSLAFIAPSFAAGTIPGISMTQQLDELAHPLSGGKLYLIQAGTTSTPQNCYQDTGLTLAWPNPVTLDAAGRVPQLFCADGSIKIRLTDKNGSQKLVQDNLLIVGPSGGGGGGGTVDPTTIFQTGAFMQFYGTNTLTGWVRCNGRTIGSASSGATERANLDAQALFQYLWSADANLAIGGGRGASAAADWAANKQLTLPDCRGRIVASLDDMGNVAAGRLTATYFGAAATVLGASGGGESLTLTAAQIPAHTHPNTLTDPGHTHTYQQPISFGASGAGAGILGSATSGNTGSSTTGITINNAANTGGGNPHRTVQPTILATTFIKL